MADVTVYICGLDEKNKANVPNLASEVVNVLSSYRLESIAVYDLTGRLLLEQPAEGISAVVKVGTLPRGTYIMAIRTQQGVATKKLVVE